MGAYDTIDAALAGLKYGIDSRIRGTMACAESSGIEFGRPVFGYVNDDVNVYNFHLDTGKLAFDADFVTGNTIDITVNGVAATQVTFTTDHDTTAGLVVAAVAALTGVECVLDSGDVNNRTFLIQTKGRDALVTEDVQGGASQATGTITYGSSQVYLGISMFVQNQDKLYKQYDAVNIIVEGWVWVETVAACKAHTDVYVYSTAGTDFGKVTSTINADYLLTARFEKNASAGNLTGIFTDGQKSLPYAGTF